MIDSSHESPCAAQLRFGLGCCWLRRRQGIGSLAACLLQPDVAAAGDDEDEAADDRRGVGHLVRVRLRARARATGLQGQG